MNLYMVSLFIFTLTSLLFFLFILDFSKEGRSCSASMDHHGFVSCIGVNCEHSHLVMYFFVTGSLNVLASVFKLELNLKEIGILGLVLVGYSLFLENFFEAMGKHAIGENIILHLFLAGVRFAVLYGAGIMLDLGSRENFITAAGLTLVALAMEFILPQLFRKKKAGGL
ncbi:hypothetical protein [Bacillus sp. SJS]|uniref:hypothetical protein n=1 Tax=Bacillus sp. SJS TaxID=1423321 RepID=UPI0004DCF48B|nr:hypothetical protein [Bacillus sp. SJS]KZZ84350.1 hypothetical protein AS29_010835 [Bacillus sp. SJS]